MLDLLVIGAGPTGLMAALTAARAGAEVILADEDARMGGRLLSDSAAIGGQTAPAWAAAVLAELDRLPNVRQMPRTTVTGAYDDGTFGALERVGQHCAPQADLPRECFWRIVARRTVLAAGALERPSAFRNNDRPATMMPTFRARIAPRVVCTPRTTPFSMSMPVTSQVWIRSTPRWSAPRA